ncbi:unnamed protein product [Meganyctiphanes norvegica]|uniref:IRF tryptophan pentad repeat domain-containing protein n=1 Tax=Meganyctiphanes norvegica TaxID=48144 RepID=A0AAV2RSK4_MEGNR
MSPHIVQDNPVDLSMKSRRKLRLDEFLRQNLDQAPAGRVIQWVDRPRGIFRILWTHQSSGAFTHEDATLFRYWAIARGKPADLSSVELKQSLRMALNKSPSVDRLQQAHDEYRYFRFTDWESNRKPRELDTRREHGDFSLNPHLYDIKSETMATPQNLVPHWAGDGVHRMAENIPGIYPFTNNHYLFNRCSPSFGETAYAPPKDMSLLNASTSMQIQDAHLVPNSDILQRNSHFIQSPPPLIELNYGYHDAQLVPGSSPESLYLSTAEMCEPQYEYSEPEKPRSGAFKPYNLYPKIDDEYSYLRTSSNPMEKCRKRNYREYIHNNESNYSIQLESKNECLDCESNSTYSNIYRNNHIEASEHLSKNTRKSSPLWNPLFSSLNGS